MSKTPVFVDGKVSHWNDDGAGASIAIPNLLLPDRINVMIDGQFGSTGKGLFAGYVAAHNKVDLAITNAAPNAGHTFVDQAGVKTVAFHLPMAGILNPDSTIYLCAGAVIDPELLILEIMNHQISPNRIYVDPNAAWLREEHKSLESNDGSAQTRLASTRKGVGEALASKVSRRGLVIHHCSKLGKYVTFGRPKIRDYRFILMEVPQGMDLGINNGLVYPYCTSREVSVSQALSDVGVHPSELGHTLMTLRTYPIRVGHITDEQGVIIGNSGPFYPDQQEIGWNDIGVEPERTTVTNRVRRVARFSEMQLAKAATMLRPDVVFLNFVNYAKPDELTWIRSRIKAHLPWAKLFFGRGPKINDVYFAG